MSEYVTKLPKEINLEGDWEVGLAEISYPHSWYSVPILQNNYFILYRNGDILLCKLMQTQAITKVQKF